MKRSLALLALPLFVGAFSSSAQADPLAITGGQFYVISGFNFVNPPTSTLVGPDINARVNVGTLFFGGGGGGPPRRNYRVGRFI